MKIEMCEDSMWSVFWVCAAIVILMMVMSVTFLKMQEDRLITQVIMDGVDPIKARCGIAVAVNEERCAYPYLHDATTRFFVEAGAPKEVR